MFFLSPEKVLVILVVALVVLGPDRLPHMARQAGKLWNDFRTFRQRLESDVRGNFPDLPSVDTISQAVRSPLSFLDTLADSHLESQAAETTATPTATSTNAAGSEVEGKEPEHGEPAEALGVTAAVTSATSNAPEEIAAGDGGGEAVDKPSGGSTAPPAPLTPPTLPTPAVAHIVRGTPDLGDVHGYN